MGLESFYVAPLEAIFECRMERRVQFRKQDEKLSAHQALVAPSVVERHNPNDPFYASPLCRSAAGHNCMLRNRYITATLQRFPFKHADFGAVDIFTAVIMQAHASRN